jgi:hypothetical protein
MGAVVGAVGTTTGAVLKVCVVFTDGAGPNGPDPIGLGCNAIVGSDSVGGIPSAIGTEGTVAVDEGVTDDPAVASGTGNNGGGSPVTTGGGGGGASGSLLGVTMEKVYPDTCA